jgi:hypothetical protein
MPPIHAERHLEVPGIEIRSQSGRTTPSADLDHSESVVESNQLTSLRVEPRSHPTAGCQGRGNDDFQPTRAFHPPVRKPGSEPEAWTFAVNTALRLNFGGHREIEDPQAHIPIRPLPCATAGESEQFAPHGIDDSSCQSSTGCSRGPPWPAPSGA